MILGIGTDIIEVSRIKKSLDRFGEDFLKHILTDEEIAYAKKYKYPHQHYAGRFAAKEAIFKAVGDPKLSWHDVSIINDKEGKPICKHRKASFKKNILISISHSKNYATAICIVTP
ncbi:MAG: holo-ACP synthase [Candidatus Omnitrophica bacterium]|nr:holo-ACP synthase [Candidatus Omnitrophota bacterium]